MPLFFLPRFRTLVCETCWCVAPPWSISTWTGAPTSPLLTRQNPSSPLAKAFVCSNPPRSGGSSLNSSPASRVGDALYPERQGRKNRPVACKPLRRGAGTRDRSLRLQEGGYGACNGSHFLWSLAREEWGNKGGLWIESRGAVWDSDRIMTRYMLLVCLLLSMYSTASLPYFITILLFRINHRTNLCWFGQIQLGIYETNNKPHCPHIVPSQFLIPRLLLFRSHRSGNG